MDYFLRKHNSSDSMVNFALNWNTMFSKVSAKYDSIVSFSAANYILDKSFRCSTSHITFSSTSCCVFGCWAYPQYNCRYVRILQLLYSRGLTMTLLTFIQFMIFCVLYSNQSVPNDTFTIDSKYENRKSTF